MSAESTAVAILNSTAGVAAKLRTFCFLAMFALTLSSICADAAEFYVALDGKDTNAGTKSAPFATLTRARDAVRALKQAEGLTELIYFNTGKLLFSDRKQPYQNRSLPTAKEKRP